MGPSNKFDYDEWNIHGPVGAVKEMRRKARRGSKYQVLKEDYDKKPYETWYDDMVLDLGTNHPELLERWKLCGPTMYDDFMEARRLYAEDAAKAKKIKQNYQVDFILIIWWENIVEL